MHLFGRQLFSELAPAIQFAHDLGDVHRVGRFPSLGFFFQLPEDDGAWAGAQGTPHEPEARAEREERTVAGGGPRAPRSDTGTPGGR